MGLAAAPQRPDVRRRVLHRRGRRRLPDRPGRRWPALDEDELDRLLGAVLTYADESFDTMLEIGFGSAIRREWAWRVNRGESLANLQAFKHLAPPPT